MANHRNTTQMLPGFYHTRRVPCPQKLSSRATLTLNSFRVRSYQVDSHFCLPHARIRPPLPQPASTHGPGAATTCCPQTPAPAAGLTDHGWRGREVLPGREPPWPPPAEV